MEVKPPSEVKPTRFYKPICPAGHDKRVVGVNPANGCCKCCESIRRAALDRRMRRRPGREIKSSNIGSAPIPNLRRVRKSLGLSIRQLADLSGVSYAMIHRVEVYGVNASRRTQRMITDALAPFVAQQQRQVRLRSGDLDERRRAGLA